MRIPIPAGLANMSAEASLGVAAAWSGAVSGLLLLMMLLRSFG